MVQSRTVVVHHGGGRGGGIQGGGPLHGGVYPPLKVGYPPAGPHATLAGVSLQKLSGSSTDRMEMETFISCRLRSPTPGSTG